MNEVRAYERVYERYYRKVLAAAEERVGTDGAPDVASEVFLVLWRRWAELGDRHTLLPWLQRACAGVAANQVRRRRREARLQNFLESLPEAEVPEDVADLVYERATLLAAWESLRPPDREILTVHVLPDHDCSTQCASSTSRSRLSRARARLADALREYDSDSSNPPTVKDAGNRMDRRPGVPDGHAAGSPASLGEYHHVRGKK
ncbi:RNA polymerase sigma factor [Embleya scabrispora]|uniref:RNA polymerase sigma factor n=1 Tax=Embleya scabrispora TaxID=159449 RepID=UPI0013750D4F|nr:sigma-70 family RNA polymerase sigma factor [Embleya scabrispora]